MQGPATHHPRSASITSSDLLDVLLITAYAVVCLLLLQMQTPTRVTGVLLLPLALFVPGYALVGALYPAAGDAGDGIDVVERAALSFGVSLSVLPLVGFVLALSGLGLALVPLISVLLVITTVGMAVSVIRRRRLPATERYRVPLYRWYRRTARAVSDAPPHVTALYLALIAAMLVATVSVAGAVAFPASGESYTELTVLAEDENGTYVAGDYETAFADGEGAIRVAVGNHEGEPADYALVVQQQRVRGDTGDRRVVQRRDLAVRRQSVAAGETWRSDFTVSAAVVDGDRRLAFLLYRGAAPEDPNGQNAYRRAYLDFSAASGDGS